jgi:mannan endo-1,4-beta-mannosidase
MELYAEYIIMIQKGAYWTKIILLLVFLQSCKSTTNLMKQEAILADKMGTRQTEYLYNRIKEIAKVGYAFGHQDATAYGIGWKNNGDLKRSDVHDVTGEYPAVYGFELGHIELGHSMNLDSVDFKLMKKLIQRAYRSGGIITLSWHPDNPVSKKSAWDTTVAVPEILNGGKLHEEYKEWLSKLAHFFNGLEDASGNTIPIVFRPFHEMNGDWFWWGKGHCTPEEYMRLWSESFDILTREFNVHNLLYAYSPNTLEKKEDYLRYYPGDSYVDILGIDIYQHGNSEEFIDALKRDIGLLQKIAVDKNKPYALSEAGLNEIPIANWWTEVLDQHISDSGISWALFWRNAWPNHYFVPFTGQTSASDFILFKNLSHVLFLNDVKKIR